MLKRELHYARLFTPPGSDLVTQHYLQSHFLGEAGMGIGHEGITGKALVTILEPAEAYNIASGITAKIGGRDVVSRSVGGLKHRLQGRVELEGGRVKEKTLEQLMQGLAKDAFLKAHDVNASPSGLSYSYAENVASQNGYVDASSVLAPAIGPVIDSLGWLSLYAGENPLIEQVVNYIDTQLSKHFEGLNPVTSSRVLRQINEVPTGMKHYLNSFMIFRLNTQFTHTTLTRGHISLMLKQTDLQPILKVPKPRLAHVQALDYNVEQLLHFPELSARIALHSEDFSDKEGLDSGEEIVGREIIGILEQVGESIGRRVDGADKIFFTIPYFEVDKIFKLAEGAFSELHRY